MTTTISLQEPTKEQLDEVLADEGHTSQDSAVKSLLLYRELYLQSQGSNGVPAHSPSRTATRTQPPSHHATDGHTAYIGKIGSGKTFTSKYHIHYQVEDNTDHDVIVIDPLSSYKEFTTRHGGTNMSVADALGSPFNFTATEIAGPDDARLWCEKIAVPFVLDALADHDFHTPSDAREFLLNRVTDIDDLSTGFSLSNLVNGCGPELPATANHDVDQALLDAIQDDECKSLDVGTPPEFPDDELVAVQLDDAFGTATTDILGATLAAFTVAAQRDNPVDLYIDNAHYLLASENGRAIINVLLRTGRHYDVYLNFVSQTIGEFLTEDENNTEIAPWDLIGTAFLHRLPEIPEEQRTELGLTNGEAAYLCEAQTGVTHDHSEILVGSYESWTPRKVQVSEDLQTLIDPDEHH